MTGPGAAPDTPIIDARGIQRVFQMGSTEVHALKGVDLLVDRGEMLSIMGTSGSGKSTLMNILGCLDRPTAGSYWLDGIPVEGLSKDQLADVRLRLPGLQSAPEDERARERRASAVV